MAVVISYTLCIAITTLQGVCVLKHAVSRKKSGFAASANQVIPRKQNTHHSFKTLVCLFLSLRVSIVHVQLADFIKIIDQHFLHQAHHISIKTTIPVHSTRALETVLSFLSEKDNKQIYKQGDSIQRFTKGT